MAGTVDAATEAEIRQIAVDFPCWTVCVKDNNWLCARRGDYRCMHPRPAVLRAMMAAFDQGTGP